MSSEAPFPPTHTPSRPRTPREPTARMTPDMTIREGAVVGGYTVVRPLGGGGMGRVYLAADPALQRNVALKVLPPGDADAEGRARFLREAHALARVQHKNVVQVFASGTDGDVAWMALEYVEGDALGALMSVSEPVDEETALALCAQAARGLSAVHAVGVVHRDVKPDNLILDANAIVRVLDFGVALFVDAGGGGFRTQKGVAIGTPHFMAPEQARGTSVDFRADAWGLGATLYALLAGRPPFYTKDDEADLDILARVLRDRAPDIRTLRPNISAGTVALLARMLEPDVEQRLSSMDEIAAACDALADQVAAGTAEPAAAVEPPAAPPESAAAQAAPAQDAAPAGGTPGWLSALGVVVVAALFAILGAALASGRLLPTPQPQPQPQPQPPVVAPPEPPVSVPTVAPSEPPPAKPSLEERAASIGAHPDGNATLITELVAENTDESRQLLALVVRGGGAAGAAVIDELIAKGARNQIVVVAEALRGQDTALVRRAIGALVELKSVEGIPLLDELAATHADKRVREEARIARKQLFDPGE